MEAKQIYTIEEALEVFVGQGVEVVSGKEELLREKLSRMSALGPQNFIGIYDFDQTLTIPGYTSYSAINKIMDGNQAFATRRDQLDSYYRPLERNGFSPQDGDFDKPFEIIASQNGHDANHVDRAIAHDIREFMSLFGMSLVDIMNINMEHWHWDGLWNIAASGITPEIIDESVSEGFVRLREGSRDLIKTVSDLGGKNLIFSAGVQNVIESLLYQQGLENFTQVAANPLYFNSNGNGHREVLAETQVFFTGGKNVVELATRRPSVYHSLMIEEGAKTVLVVGDNPQDAHMVPANLEQELNLNVLRIGVFHRKVDEDIDTYERRKQIFQENFDVIIEDWKESPADLKGVSQLIQNVFSL